MKKEKIQLISKSVLRKFHFLYRIASEFYDISVSNVLTVGRSRIPVCS